MDALFAVSVSLTNLWALPAIYTAERCQRRHSSVFLFFTMIYGVAHSLSSDEFTTLVVSESSTRYMRIDYMLVLLFIFFSDEFHMLKRVDIPLALLMVGSFILSDAVHLLTVTPQWYRLLHCIAQCAWRFIFYELVCRLQVHAYSKQE